jgi:hypothetical protein
VCFTVQLVLLIVVTPDESVEGFILGDQSVQGTKARSRLAHAETVVELIAQCMDLLLRVEEAITPLRVDKIKLHLDGCAKQEWDLVEMRSS